MINDRNDISNITNNIQFNEVKTLYFEHCNFDNPINYNNDSSDYFNINNFFHNYDNITQLCSPTVIFFQAISQFFGINQAADLCNEYIRETNTSYDYILRLRLDSILEDDFRIINLEENEVLVNEIQNYNYSIKPNDWYFMAKPTSFFKIANIYNALPCIIDFINNNRCWLHGFGYQETMLLINIIINNIKMKEYNIIKLMR